MNFKLSNGGKVIDGISLEVFKENLAGQIEELMVKAAVGSHEEDTISQNLCTALLETFQEIQGEKRETIYRPVKLINPFSNKSIFAFLDIIKATQKGNLEQEVGDILGIMLFEDAIRGTLDFGLFFWEAKKVFKGRKLKSFRPEQLKHLIYSTVGLLLEWTPSRQALVITHVPVKYLIYDVSNCKINVINSWFLNYLNKDKKIDNIEPFFIDFSFYYCYNILLGNDLVVPLFQVVNKKEIQNILLAFIRYIVDRVFKPKYILLQASGIERPPKLAIDVIKKLVKDLVEQDKFERLKLNNDRTEPEDKPNEDDDFGGPSPGL